MTNEEVRALIDKLASIADPEERGYGREKSMEPVLEIAVLLDDALAALLDENAALRRGEFICKKCGIRKDAEAKDEGF